MSRNVERLGPADRVTLTRALLVGAVTALIADGFTRSVPVTVIVTIASVALVLDAVDGKVARRTRTASSFGGRFDMEVDAFLILVLSVYVSQVAGVVGAGDRRDALCLRRRGLGVADGYSARRRRATGARWWRRSRGSC